MKQFETPLVNTGLRPPGPGRLPFPLVATSEPGRRPAQFPWLRLGAILIGLLCLPVLMTIPEGQHLLLAFPIAVGLFVLLKRNARAGVTATLVYLGMVGGIRHELIPVFGWSGTDPLLLVAPAVAVLFLLSTRRNYAYTPLMRLLLLLMVLMIAEVANPLQGGIAVGLSGLLFYVAPLLWYFLGRQCGTPAVVAGALRAVAAVSLLGAAYGLYQTFFGFTEGEKQWMNITKNSYMALGVSSSVTRAFSFFTSASEYAVFLGLGVVVLWVAFLRGHRVALLPILFLIYALFLESARGTFVVTLSACAVLWTVQGRDMRAWVPRGLLALALGGLVLFFGLRHLQTVTFSDQTQALVAHQTGGLLNPLDRSQSTATSHVGLVVNGVAQGIHTPVGLGLGSTTIAGKKFGGVSDSSEVDISNMFIGLGLAGGLLYLVVVGTVLAAAFRFWHQSRSVAALSLLGVIVALLGGWLSGGHYGASTLAWLCIGALDRLRTAAPRPRAALAREALP